MVVFVLEMKKKNSFLPLRKMTKLGLYSGTPLKRCGWNLVPAWLIRCSLRKSFFFVQNKNKTGIFSFSSIPALKKKKNKQRKRKTRTIDSKIHSKVRRTIKICM